MQIWERVAECRTAIGMSQDELGARMGLDQAVISRIEQGKRELRAHEIKQLCRIFGLKEYEFMDLERPVKVKLFLDERREDNDSNDSE